MNYRYPNQALHSALTVAIAVALLTTLGYLVAAAAPDEPTDDFQPTITTLPDISTAAEQRQALHDGRVTDSEMAAAFDAYVACIRDAGYSARVVDFVPRLGATIEWESERADEEHASQATAECRARTVVEVENLYDEQRGLTPEQRADFHKRLTECVSKESGEDTANALLMASPDVVSSCMHGLISQY